MDFNGIGPVLQVGEGACWEPSTATLLVADIWGRAVHRMDPATGVNDEMGTGEMACAVVRGRDGRAIVALERSLHVLAPGGTSLAPLTGSPVGPTERFNDATVDPAGRLIIGTMRLSEHGAAPVGQLLSHDGSAWRVLLDGFWTLNGLALSPDGQTLYLSDSHPSVARVWRAPYDAASGDIGELEVFADFTGLAGRPDGAAMAADGTYWIAGVGGGRLHAFAPDGRHARAVELPCENPTRPAFGGAGLTDLFVSTMSVRLQGPDASGMAGRTLRLPGMGPGLASGVYRG